MEDCIARLKNGKYSADGVPAEVYKALPEMTLQTLGRYMTRAFAALQLPTAWTHTYATLIPKTVHPTQTSQFRAIAHLTAIRKL
eukprot:4398166-Prorocentrum_lima.AAC.1